MKWNKRTTEMSNFGGGYESGDFVIEETFDSYNLQKEYGGKKSDYYWALKKGGSVIKYGSTAKTLKQFAETL